MRRKRPEHREQVGPADAGDVDPWVLQGVQQGVVGRLEEVDPIDRVRKVMHAYKGKRDHNMRTAPSHRLWHALLDIDGYLRGRSNWLVNYSKRYRAGLRVGTSITEGAANFLVNRRMNKSQQMRWSRRGADLLLQVRCAVYNGTLGSGLGHRFQPHANQNERSANAA